MAFKELEPPEQLLTFQRAFAVALFAAEPLIPLTVARSSEADAARRFGIYRNNVNASLSSVLASRFPVVERLVGPTFFHAMALDFVERHPPRSPILSTYGAQIPEFLDRFEPVASLPYLGDVARLEWARAIAYHAADDRPAAIDRLSSIAPDRLQDVRMTLHASAIVVSSDYPIVSIWRTNTYDYAVSAIRPDLPGEAALISRLGLDVLVTPLPMGAARLIAGLAQGETLGASAEDAAEHHSDLDLSDALARLFGAGAVSHVKEGP